MKVCYITINGFSAVNKGSGTEFYTAKFLERHPDVELLPFTPDAKVAKIMLIGVKAWYRLQHKSVWLNRLPLIQALFAHQIQQFLSSNSCDVVFSMSSVPISRLSLNIPIVFWTDAVFHQMLDYYGDEFSNISDLHVKLYKAQEERALLNSTVAVYTNTWAAECARSLGAKDVRVVPRGAGTSVKYTVTEIAALANKRREKGSKECKLLFIGKDANRKGIDFAVEVAQLLNDCGVKTTLSVVSEPLNRTFPSFVEVIGKIDKSTDDGLKTFNQLFEDADFFILPTRAEAAAIVFAEASAYGVPSLSFDTGGVSEYVKEGRNGFLFSLAASPSDFATKVTEVLSDSEKYSMLAQSSLALFNDRLNWTSASNSLVEIFKEVT